MVPSNEDILLIFILLLFTVRSKVEFSFNIFSENFLKHQEMIHFHLHHS